MRFMSDAGPVDEVKINGYHFGDRLLEDVYFRVKVVNDKITVTGVDPDSADYFAKLNQKKWLKKCTRICQRL